MDKENGGTDEKVKLVIPMRGNISMISVAGKECSDGLQGMSTKDNISMI